MHFAVVAPSRVYPVSQPNITAVSDTRVDVSGSRKPFSGAARFVQFSAIKEYKIWVSIRMVSIN